jgi:hypothetical protein
VAPTCQAAQARSLAGLSSAGWAAFPFFFFSKFSNDFPFLFSRVFNPNSIQVSNSNYFKHVQQFKECLSSA